MRSTAPLSTIAQVLPARRAAVACLLLAVLGLGASLVLAPPISGTGVLAGWRQMLPLAASLLGLLAGGLALSARPPEPALPPEDPRQAALMTALQRTVSELRDVTDAQRSELVSLREQYGEATRDAMMVGARLAGVALDAESRLSAGVSQAEQALQRPSEELTELLRRNLDRAPIPPDETALQVRAATDGLVQTISEAVANAAGRIEAIGSTAGRLERDAAALTTAGHEIATAGATVVARLADAVTRANGVLAALPVVGATVNDAANALEENGRKSLAAADRLEQESANLRSAAEAAAARIGAAADQAVAGADSALNGLPKATAELIEAASGFARGVASGEAALRDLPPATEALRSVAAALAEQAVSMSGSLDRIEAAARDSTAAFAEGAAAAAAAAGDLTGAAETLHGEGTRLAEAGSEAARAAVSLAQQTEALRETAGDAASRTEAAIADLPGLAGGLTEAAAALDTAGRQVADSTRQVADLLAADAQRGAELTRVMSEAATSMHAEATTLEEAARRISHVGGEAVAAIGDTVAQAANVAQSLDSAGRESAAAVRRLEQQTEALQASSHAAAGRLEAAQGALSELGGGLSETAGVLRRDLAALDGAARQLALSGQTLSVRLADDAARSEALLAALPAAMDGLSARAASLQTDAGALQAASRQIAGTGSEIDAAAAAIGAAMAQAAGVAQGLDTSGRDAIAATLRLQQQTVSLQATTDMAATRIAAAADQAAAIAATAAAALARDNTTLEAVQDSIGKQVAALPATTAALADAAAAMLGRTEALEDAARQIKQAGETAAAVIGDTAGQLSQAGHLVPLLDEAGRESAAAARQLHQQTEELQAAASAVATVGRDVADRLAADAARGDQVLRALPEATSVLSDAAATMQNRTGALEDAARRVASVSGEAVAVIADTLAQSAQVARALDVSGREAAAAARLLQQQNEALQSLTEAAASRIEAAADGAVEMAARVLTTLPDIGTGFNEAGGAITDAAARAESCVAGLDSASRVLCAATAEAAAQIERLGGLANETEGRLAALQTVGTAIGEAVEGLAALNLATVGQQLAKAAAALEHHAAAEPAQAASVVALAGLPEKFREAAARLESAIARQDGASATLESAMSRVQGAFEAVAQASRPAPEAARETPKDALGITLQHLGGVEQAAVQLLQQAETLAEAVLAGRAPELPGVLAERTPSLLAGLDATIGRLRSAATALALASDGPAVQPARRGKKGAA